MPLLYSWVSFIAFHVSVPLKNLITPVPAGGNLTGPIYMFPGAGCLECKHDKRHGCFPYRFASALGKVGPYAVSLAEYQEVDCHVAYCPPCESCGRRVGDALVPSLDGTCESSGKRGKKKESHDKVSTMQ